MTNLDKWREYHRYTCSPDTFIDMGFYFMISACLQRRVWCGSDDRPLYPSMYVILVGDPGVGKGLVIKPVSQFLSSIVKKQGIGSDSGDDDVNVDDATNENLKRERSKARIDGDNAMFPRGSDDTTYQGLLKDISGALGIVKTPDGSKPWYAKTGNYVHRSMYIALEELSSLFKKDSNLVCKFLLNAYDAGDYEYNTISRGKDKIRKICLHVIGGTTPGYMQDTFEDKILTDGFSARTFFVFEFSNRKTIFCPPPLDDYQKSCAKEIMVHMQNLSKLVGLAKFDPAGWELLRNVFENKELARPNNNFKLEPYYVRKNIHMMKMAMAIHFSDSLSMTISYEACKKAVDFLAHIEKNMHHALQVGSNKLAPICKNMMKYLRSAKEPVTKKELYIQFTNDLRGLEFDECIRYLVDTAGLAEEYAEMVNGTLTTFLRIKNI